LADLQPRAALGRDDFWGGMPIAPQEFLPIEGKILFSIFVLAENGRNCSPSIQQNTPGFAYDLKLYPLISY
jgi:hypothetical protein